MTIALAFMLIGIIGLAISANHCIDHAIALAMRWHWPNWLIGVILVGFGTSFPEWVVSTSLAVKGSAPMAVGNVIGSNSANIGLVLPVALLISPMRMANTALKPQWWSLLLVSVVLGVVLFDHTLTPLKGLFLLACFCLYLLFSLTHSTSSDASADTSTAHHKYSALFWLLSLVALFLSADLFTRGAIDIAHAFGVSELIIGLTVVTLGTCLPELAATIVSARKLQPHIAIGHLIGSNIFNSLLILAMPALISPATLNPHLLWRDYPVMLGLTLIVSLCGIIFKTFYWGRILGIVLLINYIAYLSYLLV